MPLRWSTSESPYSSYRWAMHSLSPSVAIRWPRRRKFGPELGEVVDLAVEDHSHRAILVVHRLLSPGHIDDREPSHSERGMRVLVIAGTIGPAMGRARHTSGAPARHQAGRRTRFPLCRTSALQQFGVDLDVAIHHGRDAEVLATPVQRRLAQPGRQPVIGQDPPDRLRERGRVGGRHE